MDRALVDTGQQIWLHKAAALIHATTEEPMVQANASKNVVSHHRLCKSTILPDYALYNFHYYVFPNMLNQF
jgi:hypothetical protein